MPTFQVAKRMSSLGEALGAGARMTATAGVGLRRGARSFRRGTARCSRDHANLARGILNGMPTWAVRPATSTRTKIFTRRLACAGSPTHRE